MMEFHACLSSHAHYCAMNYSFIVSSALNELYLPTFGSQIPMYMSSKKQKYFARLRKFGMHKNMLNFMSIFYCIILEC